MTTTPLRTSTTTDHLDLLESHAIFILREVVAECERPVLLFSGGKDSAVLLHLAVKAFAPQQLRFRSCTSTPARTSPRSSNFATPRSSASARDSWSQGARHHRPGQVKTPAPWVRATDCRR